MSKGHGASSGDHSGHNVLGSPVPPQSQPPLCSPVASLLGLHYKVENEAQFSALENHNILTEEPD